MNGDNPPGVVAQRGASRDRGDQGPEGAPEPAPLGKEDPERKLYWEIRTATSTITDCDAFYGSVAHDLPLLGVGLGRMASSGGMKAPAALPGTAAESCDEKGRALVRLHRKYQASVLKVKKVEQKRAALRASKVENANALAAKTAHRDRAMRTAQEKAAEVDKLEQQLLALKECVKADDEQVATLNTEIDQLAAGGVALAAEYAEAGHAYKRADRQSVESYNAFAQDGYRCAYMRAVASAGVAEQRAGLAALDPLPPGFAQASAPSKWEATQLDPVPAAVPDAAAAPAVAPDAAPASTNKRARAQE